VFLLRKQNTDDSKGLTPKDILNCYDERAITDFMHGDVSENLGTNNDRPTFIEDNQERDTFNAVKTMMQIKNIREMKARNKSKLVD